MQKSTTTSHRTTSILAFATHGSGGSDESRIKALLQGLDAEIFPFRRNAKKSCFFELLRLARSRKHDLFVMEGTGIAGGAAMILASLLFRTRYIVSSGDAVSAYLALRRPWARPIFDFYEHQLCRRCSGFIGWSPYLVGRAMTMGAPKGMTAAGWAPFEAANGADPQARKRIRAALGIPPDSLVFGIAGSLNWSTRYAYCYGKELVEAALQARSPNVRVLIVGDGDGRQQLERLAGPQLGKTIFLPGRVPRDSVLDYLSAMDVGSLPQSVDQVGSFRYTTKISEYLFAHLPFISNAIPLSYDLDDGFLWRLPGKAPWDVRFIDSLAALMSRITVEEIAARQHSIGAHIPLFDQALQTARVQAFIDDIHGEP